MLLLFLFQVCGTRGEESSGRRTWFRPSLSPHPSRLFSLQALSHLAFPPRAQTGAHIPGVPPCHTSALLEDNVTPEKLGDALFPDSEART